MMLECNNRLENYGLRLAACGVTHAWTADCMDIQLQVPLVTVLGTRVIECRGISKPSIEKARDQSVPGKKNRNSNY
jgi:hypothetical protein